MDESSIANSPAPLAELKLSLVEIEMLLYLLNGRRELGIHADSAKRKLNAARRSLLPVEMTVAPPRVESSNASVGQTGPTKKRNGEFNVWNRMKESSNRILPLFPSGEQRK